MKTKYKILFAKILFRVLKILRFSKNQHVVRDKINWKLDLSEGIDLSIFLFGNFENELILMIEKLSNKKEFDIIDIGANIGVHTLQFAKNYEKAKIYSIEPTAFAYEKLKKNVDLNLDLKDRVYLFQTFISNKILPEKIFSSWNLSSNESKHKLHRGIAKSTNGTSLISLDKFILQNSISKNLIIKCDVDGFELDVFKSGINFLSKYKPNIIMELAPYLYKEHGYTKKEIVNFFKNLNYKFYDSKTFKEIEDILPYMNNMKPGSSKNIFLK